MSQKSYQERPDSPTDEAHAARKAERTASNKKESVCQVSVHTPCLIFCRFMVFICFRVFWFFVFRSVKRQVRTWWCVKDNVMVHTTFSVWVWTNHQKRCSAVPVAQVNQSHYQDPCSTPRCLQMYADQPAMKFAYINTIGVQWYGPWDSP